MTRIDLAGQRTQEQRHDEELDEQVRNEEAWIGLAPDQDIRLERIICQQMCEQQLPKICHADPR